MVGQVSKGQPDSSSVITLTTARMYIDGRQAKLKKRVERFLSETIEKRFKMSTTTTAEPGFFLTFL